MEWNNSNLWFKLSRICYEKILTQAVPNLILESMIWQFVKHCVIVVTFASYLHILDSSRCLGEKGRTFRKSKTSIWVHVIFSSSKCSSFLTQRFLYIFGSCGPWCAIAATAALHAATALQSKSSSFRDDGVRHSQAEQ